MHLNSELLFEKYCVKCLNNGIKVLELGPSGSPSHYQRVVLNKDIQWHTADFASSKYIADANKNLTYTLSDPYKLPIADDNYDVVLSGQVIEHVGKIWVWLNELKRIVRKGGLIITINPVSWPYHEAPIDCWRIFPDGIFALADELGLSVVECKCESLERELILKRDRAAKFIPGRSFNYGVPDQQLSSRIRYNKVIRHLPLLRPFEIPYEVAFDTLSILRK